MSIDVGEIYTAQAEDYAAFASGGFAWNHIEKPAHRAALGKLLLPETRVLDVGCGSGNLIRYLIELGVDPKNITGIDSSVGQIEQARKLSPSAVNFVIANADSFDLPPGSFDLVVTNTVIHHLNDKQLTEMLRRVYDVLTPDGCYIFVEIDPDHNEDGRNPDNENKWTYVTTPWNSTVPFFNRDPATLLDILDINGFELAEGSVLEVDESGLVDKSEYNRYSGRPSRFAGKIVKTDEFTRICRMNDVRIPNLVPNSEECKMLRLVEDYFQAWETQSVDKIRQLFTEDAIYDEKPGKIAPIIGLEAIVDYWNFNPVSQNNIHTEHHILGYSPDGAIWLRFVGSFFVRGEHVEIDGIMSILPDEEKQKIARLVEYFRTKKQKSN